MNITRAHWTPLMSTATVLKIENIKNPSQIYNLKYVSGPQGVFMPRTSAIGQHLLEHDHIVTFNSRHLKPVVQIANFHSVISLYS